MNSNTSAAERVLNLVMALLNTSVPMTKQQIFQRVNGYDSNTTEVALSKLLERDKAMLRDIGISLTTFGTEGHAEEVGYRIITDDGEAPLVSFTSAQYAVLGLAAGLWRNSKLHETATRGLSKLRIYTAPDGTLASTPVEPLGDDLMTSLAPRLRSSSIDYEEWLEAIFKRRRVTFTYRAAYSGLVALRSVEPWQLRVRSGGWYLVGFDVDRKAPRIFHLSRVISAPKISLHDDEFPAVSSETLKDALRGFVEVAEHHAVLAVNPERAGALRARARRAEGTVAEVSPAVVSNAVFSGRDLLQVPYRNLEEFAAEVAGYGSDAIAVEPQDLRDAVLRRLRVAAELGASDALGDSSHSSGTGDLKGHVDGGAL